MQKQKLRTVRLRKQEISLEKQPIENAFVKRIDDLKFYYCLYNLQDDFKNGFYFGLLQLHPEYPFAAPKLFMYTPNGRYQTNLAICTSFTNYHQQSWTSAWNVRSLIQATISFMYANEPSYGCRHDSSQIKRKYARQSLSWNIQNQLFMKLFGQKINQKFPDKAVKKSQKQDKNLNLTDNNLQVADQKNQLERPLIQNHNLDLGDQRLREMQNQLIPQQNDDQRDGQRNGRLKKVLGGIVIGVVIVCLVKVTFF